MGYNKMIFSNNLNRMLSERGENQNDLRRICGISSSTASNWCNGRLLPRMDKVQLLCNHFGCTVSDLITEESEKPTATREFSEEDIEVIEMWHSFPDELKTAIRNLAEYRAKSDEDARH